MSENARKQCECPLKKNKNTDSRKDGEGEKEDVKSGNED